MFFRFQTAFLDLGVSCKYARTQKKIRVMYRVLLSIFAFALLISGCEKDIDQIVIDPTDPVVQISFKASAFVEVSDASGNPVPDVVIHVDNAQFTTDEDGVAHLDDVTMHPATYLVAEKAGYFDGSRRFYPSEGKTHYVKVTLLSDQAIGNIPSTAGGSITLSNGATLAFPANAVAHRDGTPYDGIVEISAQPIAANDPHLSTKMPGDLVGVTDKGDFGSLGSMGMMVVELRSSSGELLDVKEGSTVEMRMPVPAELAGSAPSSIAMWYFDEVKGIWNEDGKATLQGNTYVAEVGHFTYWNYDAWFPITKWGATFVYDDGSPAAQVSVCITILELNTTKCAQTNEDGLVCGMVASNELLLMEVTDPCGNVVFSEEIGPFSDTTMTGPYTIPGVNVSTTVVSGSTEDCDGNPVTDGFAKIRVGQVNYYVDLDDNGDFSVTVMNCDEGDVTITVVDEIALKQSLPHTFGYALMIDAGTIVVCEDLQEFIDLEVVGFPDHYLFLLPTATVTQSITRISASLDSTGGSNSGFFFVNFNGTTTGTYLDVNSEIGLELPTMEFVYATTVDVTVTYFGGVGDYIQGTVSGTMSTNPQGGGTEYPLLGTFSVIRQ